MEVAMRPSWYTLSYHNRTIHIVGREAQSNENMHKTVVTESDVERRLSANEMVEQINQ